MWPTRLTNNSPRKNSSKPSTCTSRLRNSCWLHEHALISRGDLMSTASIYDIPVRKITGSDASLAEHKGKVVLVVNVASKCGLTPQYEGLEALYRKYRDQGFVIAGFPANDFAGQEPGTNEEIQSFCTTKFGIDFPLYDKVTVVGANKHPLYASLIDAQPKAISTGPVPFEED